MGEVIHVNFKNKCRTTLNADRLYNGFIEILESHGITEEDIADVLDGIHNLNHYNTLDDDLKRFVDVWHQEIGVL
jgi:hypothetical protein